MRPWVPLTSLAAGPVLAVCLAGAGAAQGRGGEPPTPPPESFACAANDVASYTGLVTGYGRENGRTRLRIHTDRDTDERVTIRHPGSEDPSPWFRLRGHMWADSDWSRIELRRGKLRPGLRATAWVCRDGRTIVDWEAARQ